VSKLSDVSSDHENRCSPAEFERHMTRLTLRLICMIIYTQFSNKEAFAEIKDDCKQVHHNEDEKQIN